MHSGLIKPITMINQLISLSLKNRYIVLLIAADLFAWGKLCDDKYILL